VEGINLKIRISLTPKDYVSIKALTTVKQRDGLSLSLKLKNLMKHSLTVLSCAAMALVPLMPAPVKAQPPGGTTGWTKSFEDNFSNGFDTNKWIKTFWWGNGALIADGSLSWFSPDDVFVSDGSLNLEAEHRTVNNMPYTGGVASTYGKFYQTYGYFEANVKVPKGMGVGPGFSLLAEDTSWPPEINIFEIPGNFGVGATKVWMTNHYMDGNGNVSFANSEGTWTSSTGLDAKYHTYGLLWQPGLLVWYVDGVERYRTTVGVPNKPCYIEFVSAVSNSNWTGDPGSTTFPQYMSINWVRAWKPSGS